MTDYHVGGKFRSRNAGVSLLFVASMAQRAGSRLHSNNHVTTSQPGIPAARWRVRNLIPADSSAGVKASALVWMPGLGGISTRPSPFSRNICSNAVMISAIVRPVDATLAWER